MTGWEPIVYAARDRGIKSAYYAVPKEGYEGWGNNTILLKGAVDAVLRGAGLGHFAAFEASSAVPSRRIAAGLQRLGMPAAATAYFLEHVEADSVILRDPSGQHHLQVIEQNYRSDIASQQALLTAYEGKTIEFLVQLFDRVGIGRIVIETLRFVRILFAIA